ncbi:MAG: hypothetical protein OXC79_08320 [Candidatus Poribacteria bacterium]|nr:hypothetical protein [Candidatus Poribacteria bacterium]
MANNTPMTHEDHWSHPVAMAPDGQWISLREMVEEAPTQVPFNRLSLEEQSELVAERIRQSPEFEVGILGQQIVDKKHAIDEVQKRTSIGRALIDVEQRMIRMLIKRALEGNL